MIRLAKHPEIEEIMHITKACAAKMISENIFQWNEYYPNAKAFYNDLERNELYVLTEVSNSPDTQHPVLACITISSEKDAEYTAVKWLTKEATHLYIHRLAVHPKFQHQGLAKKLMDFAEGLGRNNKVTSIRLDTFSVNKRNQKFYENRGYTRLGDIFFPKQSEFPFYCYELLLE